MYSTPRPLSLTATFLQWALSIPSPIVAIVSVLHKELEYKVESSSTSSFRSCTLGSESNPSFHWVNKPSQISPYEVLQLWLINAGYHLSAKSDKGEERGAYYFSSPEKGGGGRLILDGQLNRGFTVLSPVHCIVNHFLIYRRVRSRQNVPVAKHNVYWRWNRGADAEGNY